MVLEVCLVKNITLEPVEVALSVVGGTATNGSGKPPSPNTREACDNLFRACKTNCSGFTDTMRY